TQVPGLSPSRIRGAGGTSQLGQRPRARSALWQFRVRRGPFFERLVLERETGLPRSTPSARSFLRTALQITGEAGLPRGTLSVAHDVWEAFGKGTPGDGRNESGL